MHHPMTPLLAFDLTDFLRRHWLRINDGIGLDHAGWSVMFYNSGWMFANTVLAWIPWVLSRAAFDERDRSRWERGLLIAATIAFLPNSPYIVTDLIHMHRDYEATDDWVFTSMLIAPTFFVVALSGMIAYALVLDRLEAYVRRHGWGARWWPMVLGLHFAVAVALWFGRVVRLNSWEFLTAPHRILGTTVDVFTDPIALGYVALTFVWVTAFHLILRRFRRAPAAAVRGSTT
jgi:uncharacterized membrane protein